MLSFVQWFSRNDEQRGPILVPIGQISVLLPRAVHLDEWTLVGIQERDIVTGPDQSREYQLTQFLPEASAIARTSTSEPRLSDSVVTVVEPAGRLATVRCLVNVQCEEASVVELQWPVSQGWQVIAARYASNSRALFFEFPKADPEAATSPLTLHLPESLEPGTSRMVEIQFRQSDEADARTINLPLAENPASRAYQCHCRVSTRADTQHRTAAPLERRTTSTHSGRCSQLNGMASRIETASRRTILRNRWFRIDPSGGCDRCQIYRTAMPLNWNMPCGSWRARSWKPPASSCPPASSSVKS